MVVDITALSLKQRAMFELRLKKKRENISPVEIGRRVAGKTFLPLSFAQQRLWFLQQLNPSSSAYNIHFGVRLTGRLDVAALEHTLGEIVRRHEVLRTVFAVVDGTPVQLIAAEQAQRINVVDLSRLAEEESEREAHRLAREDERRPFDLTRGPMLRANLLRINETEHVLLVTMHHIISDSWSMGIWVREVAALYEAHATGREAPLEELPIQYADYAIWQREWLRGGVSERQLEYWKSRLANAPALLELPTDRPRPAVQSFRGALKSFGVGQQLTAALNALGRREGATLYMTLLAAFQCLLYRYSGQDDIVVGTPVAGRNRIETENLVGFFINTLALRTSLSGDPTFCELLGRVRDAALGAYTHQDVPFERLVEELQPERSRSHTPLFQVWFVLQNAPMGTLELANLTLRPLETAVETAQFDLTLSMVEVDSEMRGELTYSTALFDCDTIDEMLRQFLKLLETVAAHPGCRLLDIPLGAPESEAEAARSFPHDDAPAEDQFAL